MVSLGLLALTHLLSCGAESSANHTDFPCVTSWKKLDIHLIYRH